MAETTNVPITPDLNGYAARAGQGRPGVVVIMEAFGVTGHIRGVCDRLAKAGFSALAPDIFHGEVVAYTNMDRALEKIRAASDDVIQREIGASIDWLAAKANGGAPAVGVIGFCMGGRLAFHANCRHADRLNAAVGFYGGGIAPEGPDRFGRTPPIAEAGAMQAPLFLGYGADDAGITPGEHANIVKALSAAKKAFELRVYPGAGHAFLCEERPKNYAPRVAELAWREILSFLSIHLAA